MVSLSFPFPDPRKARGAKLEGSPLGKFEIDAEFVDVRDGVVRLKKTGDGSVISVRLGQLSPADRQFVEGLAPPPSKSVDTLIPLLENPDTNVRHGALDDLAAMGKAAEAAVPDLQKYLEQFYTDGGGVRGNALAAVAALDAAKEAIKVVATVEAIGPDDIADFYEEALKHEMAVQTRDYIIKSVLALPKEDALDVLAGAIKKPASLGAWSALGKALRSLGEEGARIADRADRAFRRG